MMAGYPYQFGSNATAQGVATHEIPIRGINRAYFNQVKGPFTDVRARQAFYAAIDRAPPDAGLHADGRLYAPRPTISARSSPYFDADLYLAGPRSAEARRNCSTLCKADGKPFDIKIVTYTNSDLKRLAAYVQQVLSGIRECHGHDRRGRPGQSHPALQGRSSTSMSASKAACWFPTGAEPNISNLLSSSGAFNWGQYKSPDMDAALAEANATIDPDKVKSAYCQGAEDSSPRICRFTSSANRRVRCCSATIPAASSLRTAASCRSSSSSSARMPA